MSVSGTNGIGVDLHLGHPRESNSSYPLTSSQQRIWFFEELAPDVPLYNESEAVRLVGELHGDALEQALNAVVARHEVLRTTIKNAEQGPMAIVHESWQLRIKLIDLSSLSSAERAEELERLLVDEPRRSFRLDAEPGIRATLLRLEPSEHVFILMMHHIVSDWASEGILWRELSSAYRSIVRAESPSWSYQPSQFGDYAFWQQQRVDGAKFARDLDFWAENLRGAPELLELPSDRPRPSEQTFRGARHRVRLDDGLTEALRNLSRREKTTLFTVFAAALDTLLYRYTGSEDILLGVPVSDRRRPELQTVIGLLLDTQVLRTELSADITFVELLARMRKGLLALYRRREVPFDLIVNKLRPERSSSYSPLFQVLIAWRDQDESLSAVGLEGLAVEAVRSETKTSRFDFTLLVTDHPDEIWLEAEYNADLFDADRIARMLGHLQTLLEAAADDPTRRLAELPLLTAIERQQLIDATEVAYPRETCVHQLFEMQAEKTPDAVAAVSDEREVTYRELNERSNRLARHLIGLGVAPGVLVGICVERSIEMIVGLLGTMKAGGAYIPLDPSYPQERLAFMLRDSGASLILTQSSLRESLPGDCNVVCLDTDWRKIAEEESSNPDSNLNAENLAYVIYTSGSTGRPKGVEITHRSV
ncbi:MAG: condensation domain-containing protein, partial [Candidatus Binatus sp.]